MGKDNEFDPNTDQEFRFMNETIKHRPRSLKRILTGGGLLAAGGIVFGISASVAFTWAAPSVSRMFGNDFEREGNVQLVEPPAAESESEVEASETEAAEEPEVSVQESLSDNDPIDDYEKMYSRAMEVAEKPRKALVTVTGISDKADLLDETILSNGDSIGILFLETAGDYYLLTENAEFEEAERLLVTLSDGTTVKGKLCRADRETGLAVVRFSAKEVDEETRKEIAVARLADSYTMKQARSVIAIGSPTGDLDSVLYGVVTAVSGKVSVADAEYDMITTDMHGSAEGSGFLLDTDSRVIGFILAHDDEEPDMIRALDIAQALPLVEQLANNRPISYLGIHGVSISQAQAEALHMEKGIYVDKIENASPAMNAGLQRGDVIVALDGEPITDMKEYTIHLQKLRPDSEVKVSIYRKNNAEYADILLNMKVKER